MKSAVDDSLNRTLSPHEQMNVAGLEHYFKVGRSALDCIRSGLRAAGRSEADEPPFGVERIWICLAVRAGSCVISGMAFPNACITACDLSRAGVDFCAATFDAIPIYSSIEPEDIPIPRGHYDLIWVGSLFTHLEGAMWESFLQAFHAALRPDGVLIFTTHGQRAHNNMATRAFHYGHDDAALASLTSDYDRHGFGYVQYPGSNWHYGTSVSRADWVNDRIRAVEGLGLIQHAENAWDRHQDCFVCRRDS